MTSPFAGAVSHAARWQAEWARTLEQRLPLELVWADPEAARREAFERTQSADALLANARGRNYHPSCPLEREALKCLRVLERRGIIRNATRSPGGNA